MAKKKILIVDNHPMVLRMLANLLEKEGHEVRVAKDGLAALEVLKEFVPEVVFVDLVMPNISGEKLCRIIRSLPHLEHVYIAILSAIAAEERLDPASLGADVCIAKGSFKHIARHVATVLEQADSATSPTSSILGLDEIYQREITKELLSSRKHFEVILNNMSEGIIEITPARQVIYLNPRASALLDQPEEKVLAGDFLDLFPAHQRETVADLLKRLQGAPVATAEQEPVSLAGRQVSLSLYPVADNGYSSIIILFRDVTEFRRAEERLRKQHAFLEKILASMQHPFYVTDARTFGIVHANQAARELLGMEPGQAHCFEVSHGGSVPCRKPERFCPVREVQRTGKAVSVEHLHHDRQGREVYHEVHAYPVFNDQGQVVQVIQYLLDVSERHRAEAALRRSTARLQQAYADLQKAQAVMVRQEKLASIGTLASGVAHEILNPLNTIGTIVQLLQTEELPGQVKEQLELIMDQIRRATKITNNLRMFSHQRLPEISRVDLNRLFDATAGLVEHDFSLENIVINRRFDPELPEIEADEDQLAQVFLNLLSNARAALEGREKKEITVTTSHDEHGVEFRFADTGVGIDQEKLAKIFDPFFTTKDPGHGTGLGLSIVYSVIENHGGAIEVHSEKNQGTEFVIRLPLRNRPAGDDAAGSDPDPRLAPVWNGPGKAGSPGEGA